MTRLALLFVVVLLSCPTVRAHSDEYFTTHPTPHGGQMRMAGPFHFELLVAKDELTLYVTDHSGAPIDTTGGSAKVIINTGKKKRYVVILSSAGENRLTGSDQFTLGRSSTASVLVALPGQEPQRAKFVLHATGKSKKARKRH